MQTRSSRRAAAHHPTRETHPLHHDHVGHGERSRADEQKLHETHIERPSVGQRPGDEYAGHREQHRPTGDAQKMQQRSRVGVIARSEHMPGAVHTAEKDREADEGGCEDQQCGERYQFDASRQVPPRTGDR